MQLARWSLGVSSVCGTGNSSCPKETKSLMCFFRHKDSQWKPCDFPPSLCVNCGNVSFCVSSRNNFTVVEFLMEIKSIQQESSCLPLWFSFFLSAFWGEKEGNPEIPHWEKANFHFLMYPKRQLLPCLLLCDGETVNRKSTRNTKC